MRTTQHRFRAALLGDGGILDAHLVVEGRRVEADEIEILEGTQVGLVDVLVVDGDVDPVSELIFQDRRDRENPEGHIHTLPGMRCFLVVMRVTEQDLHDPSPSRRSATGKQ
jgi:hypothetical protein